MTKTTPTPVSPSDRIWLSRFYFQRYFISNYATKTKTSKPKKEKNSKLKLGSEHDPRQLANETINSWGTSIVDSPLFIDSFVPFTLNFLCHKIIGRNVIWKNIKYSSEYLTSKVVHSSMLNYVQKKKQRMNKQTNKDIYIQRTRDRTIGGRVSATAYIIRFSKSKFEASFNKLGKKYDCELPHPIWVSLRIKYLK